MCVRALASENATLSHFTISKSYFINYTISFYNTPNIPKFCFSILHIKILYLHNKIYFLFFSNFFLLLSSTSITAPPLPSHHHCASTMPTTAHCLPKSHRNKNPYYKKKKIKKKKTIGKAEPRRTSQPCGDQHRSPPNPSP